MSDKPTIVQITGPEPDSALYHIKFEPNTFVSAGKHSTALVLDLAEYAALERAMSDLAAEEAAESGDFEKSCPVCGGPLPCSKCLADLRCDS